MTHRLRLNWDNAATAFVLLYAITVVALLLAGVCPHLLKPEGGSNPGGDFGKFLEAINKVKGPATAALAALSTIGLLLGGCLLALGQQTGTRIMALAACAGGGVLLGNGLIA